MAEYKVASARLKRAVRHGEQLATLWNEIPAGRLCVPRARVGADGYGELIATEVGEMPTEIPLLLGELLYQLRSALDACIYRCAVITTKSDPPPDATKLEFPITFDSTEWPRLEKRRLIHMSQDMRDAIEIVQPYNAPRISPGVLAASINRTLGIINDLARKDRHRKIHVVGSWPFDLTPSFVLPTGVSVDSITPMPPAILTEGTVIATFWIRGYQSGVTEAEVNPKLRTTFGCAEPPLPIDSSDTFETRIRDMFNTVKGVIEFFERNT